LETDPAPVRPPASEALSASLEPRAGGRLRRSARLAGAVVSQLALQLVPSPALHDVVVRRRDDGAEVLRVDSFDPLRPGDMLSFVRAQLEELDEQAFLAEWEPRTPS
jgi:hypothetical protein